MIKFLKNLFKKNEEKHDAFVKTFEKQAPLVEGKIISHGNPGGVMGEKPKVSPKGQGTCCGGNCCSKNRDSKGRFKKMSGKMP